jgi:hypothetical protein
MTHVLGLDLSKVGLGQALEAMAEAWLDAQGVEDEKDADQVAQEAAHVAALNADPYDWMQLLRRWAAHRSQLTVSSPREIGWKVPFYAQEAANLAGIDYGERWTLSAQRRISAYLLHLGFVKVRNRRGALLWRDP